jgi:hypothetical protein
VLIVEVMSVKSLLFFLLLPVSSFGQISQLVDKLDKSADFALEHYEEINFDGLLGFVIAEGESPDTIHSFARASRLLKPKSSSRCDRLSILAS